MAGEFNIRWQHLVCFDYVHSPSYKEDRAILRMLGCEAIALPSTKQIVSY